MFNLFKKKDAEKAPDPWSVQANAARRSSSCEPFAKFETMGQTLIATITETSLSGPDAIALVEEIGGRLLEQDDEVIPGVKGERHLVLDLQNVEYMDSACIGAVVDLFGKLRQRSGQIALANAGRNVEYLFRLTQLDRIFPICKDVMKAIEAVERAG
ncbi:MAG: STAS domain-containing protein [Phycisphaerales bacterium]|nr:STAS domain-containing protein [Phycisphaerales bacterium]